MANAVKFLFGQDFSKPSPEPEAIITRQNVEDAEARGYGRGLQDGLRQAELAAKAHLAAAMERLAQSASAMLATIDAQATEAEAQAVDFSLALARKLAGRTLDRDPLGPMADAAAEAFRHLRGVPHLVIRVNETLVESVDALVRQMARERGFEGRIVTMGEPDIVPGDIRLEWADGGVVRSQSRIEQAVMLALGQA
jgi:flagellar assembly protein FliH